MRRRFAFAMLAALPAVPASGADCPPWEPGMRYPWQTTEVMRGDRFAWMYLEVDREGRLIRCKIGANNYPDSEARLFVCKAYYDFYRGPPAAASDPRVRTLERFHLVPGPRRQWLERKARMEWFAANPGADPRCYPEPTRPDRLL
jgi:hypothetical protein